MPELPEVELVVRGLKEILKPPVLFCSLNIICPKLMRDEAGEYAKEAESQRQFMDRLLMHTVVDIHRRGKYIIFEFDHNVYLVCHLRMTGRFMPLSSFHKPSLPYERGRFLFKRDGSPIAIAFCDVRRFGEFRLYGSVDPVYARLGPEPFDDRCFSHVCSALKDKTAPIKALLLDQRIFSGVGNIYADEALFEAKISPRKKGSDLSIHEIEKLQKALIMVLQKSIGMGGSSLGEGVGNFSSPYAVRGKFQDNFKVYHKHGSPCPRCGAAAIEKTTIRGRSTHYCPLCQRE